MAAPDSDRDTPATWLRLAECAAGFFVLPPCLYFVRHQLAWRISLLALALALGAVLFLVRAERFDRRSLWSTAGLPRHLRAILLLFLPAGLLLSILNAVFLPDRFLIFPLERPGAWVLVMLLYPILGVYPQELLFRAFFFHRYRRLFHNDAHLVLLNGLSFGLAHLVYGNWIAFTLATLGGIIFAYRYLRTGSLLAASLEHGLWGDYVFTIGIGWYLYSGAIR